MLRGMKTYSQDLREKMLAERPATPEGLVVNLYRQVEKALS